MNQLTKVILTFTSILGLTACQSTSAPTLPIALKVPEKIELTVSNYKSDFRFPNQTSSLVMIKQDTSDEPLFGTRIHYENRFFDQDQISLHAYPIRHLEWPDPNEIILDEMQYELEQIDKAIEQGVYQRRIGSEIIPFETKLRGIVFNGLRAHTEIFTESGVNYQSYIYLFTQKDKFVKFQISQPNAENLDAPDEIVKEVLPYLEVPGESSYMANLREQSKFDYQGTESIEQ